MTRIAKSPAICGYRTQTNRGRGRCRLLLRAAAALLAIGTLTAPASASPFQQYLNGACKGTLCKINFLKIPAGRQLSVNNASCYIRLGLGAGGRSPEMKATQFLVLGADPKTVVSAVTIAPTLVGVGNDEIVVSANHATTMFARPQQRIQAYVELFSGTFSQVACHVSGDLAKAS
jgi:hypothetical protein